jgi:hypothetical protein
MLIQNLNFHLYRYYKLRDKLFWKNCQDQHHRIELAGATVVWDFLLSKKSPHLSAQKRGQVSKEPFDELPAHSGTCTLALNAFSWNTIPETGNFRSNGSAMWCSQHKASHSPLKIHSYHVLLL